MFDTTRLYSQRLLAAHTGRTTRTLRNWRERGLLPEPDVLMGGTDPSWWGSTLNSAPAFARPAETATP
jgi:hypothetical protein